MDSKPVSYDSLKVLMQYLSSTTRMKISLHCPSLRKLEKVVPLRLQYVTLRSYYQLDNMKFELHLVRKCPEGVSVPRCFQYGFDAVKTTLDPHGYPDIEDRLSWTPGDIVRTHLNAIEPEEVADRIAALQERIGGLKAQLPEGGGLLEDLNRIESYEIFLQALENRRDNISSPYKISYRLRVTQDGQEPQCYYSKVDMKFSLKMKKLATSLFGGRRDPILVRELLIGDGVTNVRMPPGRLFKAHYLTVPRLIDNDIVAASALHESSFPLEELSVDNFQPDDMNCPTVRDAKHLTIRVLYNQPVVNFVIENYHPSMTIRKLSGGDVSYNNVIEIITQTRARGRDFFLNLEFETAPNFLNRLRDVARQFHVEGPSDRVSIPMQGDMTLYVSFKDSHPFKVRICTLS